MCDMSHRRKHVKILRNRLTYLWFFTEHKDKIDRYYSQNWLNEKINKTIFCNPGLICTKRIVIFLHSSDPFSSKLHVLKVKSSSVVRSSTFGLKMKRRIFFYSHPFDCYLLFYCVDLHVLSPFFLFRASEWGNLSIQANTTWFN